MTDPFDPFDLDPFTGPAGLLDPAATEPAGASAAPLGESEATPVGPLPASLLDPAAMSGCIDTLTLSDDLPIVPQPDESVRTVHLVLDGDSLEWSDLLAVLDADRVRATLAPGARRRMAAARRGALDLLENDPTARVYGWNQALGPLKDRALGDTDQRRFQANVLRSHAAGIGEYLSAPIARLALVIRANVLARGTTGARPELVDRILDVVAAGVVPLMPEVGSLGTGDLQPMAAAGLCLTGEPVPAADGDGIAPADELLARHGLPAAFPLEAGEAIALISGSAVLSACLTAATRRLSSQLDTFLGGFALFCESTRAEAQAFDARVHAERRIPAEAEANDRILALVGGSAWMTPEGRARLGETGPRIQDSTSVRSTPHKVANVLHVIDETAAALVREANASTANPLLFPDERGGYEFVTGGNWDCTLLGQQAHALNVAATDLAVLSKDLSGRLGNALWSYGLPASLAGGIAGLNSGMTLVHAVGASLVPEMQVRASPVGSLSFPLKGGQEDHNTMAMASVRNLVSNLDRFDVVLAVLLLMSAQGIDLIAEPMDGLPLSPGAQEVHAMFRERIEPLDDDRYMTDDINLATKMVRSGELRPPTLAQR